MRRQSSTVVSATTLPCLLSCALPQAGEDERYEQLFYSPIDVPLIAFFVDLRRDIPRSRQGREKAYMMFSLKKPVRLTKVCPSPGPYPGKPILQWQHA